MKTRIRHTQSSKRTIKGPSPMLKWAIAVAFLYSILWWIFANDYPGIFLAGLLYILPAFAFTWLIAEGIIVHKIFEKYFVEMVLFLWMLLSGYIYTIVYTPSFFLLTLSLFAAFTMNLYFKYIREDKAIKMKKAILKTKARDWFNVLLKNKNFLNHHNYYHSQKKEQEYKSLLLKWSITSSITTMAWISFVFFLIAIGDANASISAGFKVSSVLFIGWSMLLVFRSLFIHYTKTIWKPIKIYQKYVSTDYFVKVKNKIFTY